MGLSLLRYLAYALIPAVTVLWGESLRARLLYRGGRRAIRLLIAALLMWQLVRLMKYMFEPVADASPEHAFWYLYYVFRAALPVALLWIAHVADADAAVQKLPRHLLLLLLMNLFLAFCILTNDWHEQFFSFLPEREGELWEEQLEWGAYAYWVIWFLEVFASLAIFWIKAGLQQSWRLRMILPFLLYLVFLLYTVFYNISPVLRIDVTFTTTVFFLLFLELCLRTGLILSNHEYEGFFRQASLGLRLTDPSGKIRLSSRAVPDLGGQMKEYRISRMRLSGGSTLIWYEDMHMLHEQQRSLAQANRALQRRRLYLKRAANRQRKQVAAETQNHLHREVEGILDSLRPYFRKFRTRILQSHGNEREQAVRDLNLLATYTKKRCVLFLKSEENGTIALDELEMAASELCEAARKLQLHVAISWQLPQATPAQTALTAFDSLTSFLAEAVHERAAMTVHVTMAAARVTFLLEGDVPWLGRWQQRWLQDHMDSRFTCKDLGFALSIACVLRQEEGER
ncbi:MAG: hypothetical protein PUG02_06785 [Selenomonadaceae bacterium]|nr:hypothetical protein [Selenomonadaceae bacterium]